MEHYNFKLFGKRVPECQIDLPPKFIKAVHGDSVELIATGERATDALDTSVRLLEETPPCFHTKD